MFEVVKRARLSPAEFGRIVGVSRIAAYNWMTGRSSPHTMIHGRAEKALQLIDLLIKKEKLPLRDDLDRATRRAKIAKIKEILESYI